MKNIITIFIFIFVFFFNLNCGYSKKDFGKPELEKYIYSFKIEDDINIEKLFKKYRNPFVHADWDCYWKSEDRRIVININDYSDKLDKISILSKSHFIDRFPNEGKQLFNKMGIIKGLTIKTGRTLLKLGIDDTLDDAEKIYTSYNFETTKNSNEIIKKFRITNIGNYKEYIFTIKANQNKKIKEIEIFVDFCDD